MSLKTRTFAALVVGLSTLTAAESRAQIKIVLPEIHFSAPPVLVVVGPGVQVVEDHDEEIFFTDGLYWTRSGKRWFKSRDHKGQWVVVDPTLVPASVSGLPPGQYKKYRGGAGKMIPVGDSHPGKGKGHKKGKGPK